MVATQYIGASSWCELLAKRAREAGRRPPSKLVTVFGVNAPGEHTGLRIAYETDGVAVVPVAAFGP
ncbi:MAG: hypothetical protein OXE75_12490 [bacterium]|nr:hypothetical protein [bacterium]